MRYDVPKLHGSETPRDYIFLYVASFNYIWPYIKIEGEEPSATTPSTGLEIFPERNVGWVTSGMLFNLGRRLGMKDCILARLKFVLGMASFDGLARYKNFFGHGEV